MLRIQALAELIRMIRVLRENRTLQEMLIGILISGIVLGIIGVIFSDRDIYCLMGLGIGMLGAAFMGTHMAYTIEDAVLLSENDATAYIRKMTYIRYAVACVLMIVVGITDIASPVMCIFGLLLLKAGAYMAPLIHRLFFAKTDDKEPKLPFDIGDEDKSI